MSVGFLTVVVAFFLLFFSLRVPIFVNSSALVGLLSASFLLATNSKRIIPVVFTKAVIFYLLAYLFVVVLVAIFVLGHGTSDFSRLESVASNVVLFVSVLCCSVVFSSFFLRGDKFYLISEVVFFIFLFQAFFIIFSLLSDRFLGFVQVFQSPLDSVRAEKYSGVRGLALSGGQFFPLSAQFAIAEVFSVYYLLKTDRFLLVKTACLLVIVFAGLTAGRVSVVGFCFGLALLFIVFLDESMRSRAAAIFVSVLMLCFVGGVMLLLSPAREFLFEFFLPFAFEYIYSFLEGDGGSIESTEVLRRMYWSVDAYRGGVGYGRYSSGDGTFMDTDGGYMRNTLLMGYGGVVFFVMVTIAMFVFIYSRLSGREFIDKVTLVLLCALFFLLHYKGDVLLHLVGAQSFIAFMFVVAAIDEALPVRSVPQHVEGRT